MIKLNGTGDNSKSNIAPDLHVEKNSVSSDSTSQPSPPVRSGESVGDANHSTEEQERAEEDEKKETFSNKSSSYSRFILKDGEPYLDAMPGVELDRDSLISSAADVIAQLEDPKKVDAFTKSVCRALKCATTDISRSANSKDDAVAAIAVAASAAPTFAKRSTLWKDDVQVEDDKDEAKKKQDRNVQNIESNESDDIYSDQET